MNDDYYDPPGADELTTSDIRAVRNEATAMWAAVNLVHTLTIAAAECRPELQEALARVFDLRGTIDEHRRIGALLMEVIGRQSELEARMVKMQAWMAKCAEWAKGIHATAKRMAALETKLADAERRMSALNAKVPYPSRNGVGAPKEGPRK